MTDALDVLFNGSYGTYVLHGKISIATKKTVLCVMCQFDDSNDGNRFSRRTIDFSNKCMNDRYGKSHITMSALE